MICFNLLKLRIITIMMTLAFLVLLIAFEAVGVEGAVVPSHSGSHAVHNSEDLQYLGLLRYNTPSKGTSSAAGIEKRQTSTAQQTSYYFLSQNSAAHFIAESDCKAYLGEEASLLFIETQEELKAVTKFLSSSDDTGATYWIGGKYDVLKKIFVWGNGGEVGPWAPWDANFPDTRTPLTRILAYTVGVRSKSGLKFRTALQTVSNRYICELKVGSTEEEALPCYKDNDLAIVIDGSDSVQKNMYPIVLEFATRLALAWSDNPDNRLSVIITSTNGQSVFGLNSSLTVVDYREKIPQTPYLGGGADLGDGIGKAMTEFTKNERSTVKNLVLLTASPLAGAEKDGEKLAQASINTFAVGIGTSLSSKELIELAGNKPERVYMVDGFDKVLSVLQSLSRKICNDKDGMPTKPAGDEDPDEENTPVGHITHVAR